MANPWFKFYGIEYLADQKIAPLRACYRSCWVTLLCYAGQNDGIIRHLDENTLKIQSGINPQDDEWDVTRNVFDKFKELGMITVSNGEVTVINWQKRQQSSLSNSERQARYRERHNEKVTDGNNSVTLEKKRKEVDKKREEKKEKDTIAAKPQDVVNYFFELKGWDNKDKDFYSKKKIVYSRYMRPAKDLLSLCDDDMVQAKFCLKKISEWATSRELDWSIETVFKKWYEIDDLKTKDKKPYYDNCRIFQKSSGGKWYIIRGGEVKELGITLKKEHIVWK